MRPTPETPAELDELRQTVLRICRDFGHEYYVRSSDAGDNARDLWRALGGIGALGAGISEEHGGAGAGVESLAVVAEAIAEAGLPLMLVALSPAVCATMIDGFGTPEQKAEWLPGLADGSRVLGFAITEPDAGSNTHNLRMRARREGDQWVLSGQKYYVSHVDNADALLTVARVEDELKVFIVPTDAPGLTKSPIEVEILSPERQYSVFYDGVRVDASAIVGADAGMAVLYAGLNPERIISAALLNGIARYAIDIAAGYARERTVWSVPIGAHQAVSHPLARAETALTASRLLTNSAARAFDRGETGGVEAAMAKLTASEAASDALDAAMQTLGGNGMSREYGLATLHGLVRLFRIAPVSSEMLLNHVAHKRLSLPRSY
ncbi:acyl-CoA dehydrogenase family protein [Actinomadura livida]|uniref:Acyl-CoA dehydrogenase family protein n=1 Tax=Actinomadura livida TaxID=79909 RepID=A0A7W7I7A8_9ACTN|nr:MULTISPECIES: acyl-CoA dehydrogenase family protein [Actinomadura]MBB4771704.1 alkylation response protein AidB-like acyl-CoA dehydrogenase [Actinomadura catellatispora]GGU01978.1 putative acyl-CoA dehydrogenase FadE [Actinomadura livida]